MGSKRKYVSEDDYAEPQASRKRSRRITQETAAASNDEDSDHHRTANPSRRSHQPAAPLSRAEKKARRLAAELADLADYNKPPETPPDTSEFDTQRNNEPRISRRTRKTATVTQTSRVHRARIAKPTTPCRKKRSEGEKLLAEVARLTPWSGWASEDEESSSSSEEEDDYLPRVHSRRYPPKVKGTQNAPWSELPGEIRNSIYEYAIANEEDKILNVRHYPDGVPRRSVRGISSDTNFAHSDWGLTQACKQTRAEFTPWLLKKRQVRTALATLNKYVDTFHRLNDEGRRIGWVEPICCGDALPGAGVDVLKLMKIKDSSPEFHLQLTPTAVSAVLEALTAPAGPDDFDELKIMHDMYNIAGVATNGLTGIHITSVVDDNDLNMGIEDGDNAQQHEILIKLDVDEDDGKDKTFEERLEGLNSFIFMSHVCDKKDVTVEARFENRVAKWNVRGSGLVDMYWRPQKGHGDKTRHRLVASPDRPYYEEDDL
jgi:hypothetical protein